MTEPLTRFLDAVQDNDVDDALLKTPLAEKALVSLERYGLDLGEKVENFFKRPPEKPSGPTPSYKESAFVKPKQETTLYNVTNKEAEVPFIEKASKVFKNASYGVRSFTASATYKHNDNGYSLYAGEKVGLGWEKSQGGVSTNIKAEYNVGNGKTNVEYTQNNPLSSYNVSIFNQDGNNGLCAGYSNHRGFNSAFSIDEHSASLSCGYNKKYEDCKVELRAYATTGDNYSNPFAGVSGRITF